MNRPDADRSHPAFMLTSGMVQEIVVFLQFYLCITVHKENSVIKERWGGGEMESIITENAIVP